MENANAQFRFAEYSYRLVSRLIIGDKLAGSSERERIAGVPWFRGSPRVRFPGHKFSYSLLGGPGIELQLKNWAQCIRHLYSNLKLRICSTLARLSDQGLVWSESGLMIVRPPATVIFMAKGRVTWDSFLKCGNTFAWTSAELDIRNARDAVLFGGCADLNHTSVGLTCAVRSKLVLMARSSGSIIFSSSLVDMILHERLRVAHFVNTAVMNGLIWIRSAVNFRMWQ